jgi:hypothetical protein
MANVDITKILVAGSNRVKVYHKVVEAQPSSSETVTFTDSDLVTYLSNLGDIGAEKDTVEVELYHLANKGKITTGSTLTDLELTEALTTDALTEMREAYENSSFMVTAIFDKNNKQVYGCFGQISKWGASLPLGSSVSELTYTIALSDDNITCTQPSSGD